MTNDQRPPAGWYPDQSVDAPAGQQRYWDGSAWTDRTTAPTTVPTEAASTVPTGADYQPPPTYQAAVQQAPRNGLGTTALILGIIGVLTGIIPFLFWVAGILGIIGLILGLVGLSRGQRGEATNGTMALWGIITSAVAVVLSIVGLVIFVGVFAELGEEAAVVTESTVAPATESPTSPAAETSPPPHVEETAPALGVEVDVYKLKVGDCFIESQDDAEEEYITTVQIMPCSESHSDEVFALVTLPEGDFPGLDGIDSQAGESCEAEFEGFVGLSYQESDFDFWTITPDEEGWRAGDRSVVCVIYDPDSEVSESLRGAER
jgi:hypothetical protein